MRYARGTLQCARQRQRAISTHDDAGAFNLRLCHGLFSSRRIERATYESVAVRYLCANHHPDHDTIAKFRRENEALFGSCFSQVLLLAQEAGVLRVGAVSVDGTRVRLVCSGTRFRPLRSLQKNLSTGVFFD